MTRLPPTFDALPAYAVAAAVAVLTGCGSGCFFEDPAICRKGTPPAFRVVAGTPSGDRVAPDRMTVDKKEGTRREYRPSCSSFPWESRSSTRGTYTVRATCGSRTVEKTFTVRSDECGPITRQVQFEFPPGVCTNCSTVDVSTPDADAADDAAADSSGRDSSDDRDVVEDTSPTDSGPPPDDARPNGDADGTGGDTRAARDVDTDRADGDAHAATDGGASDAATDVSGLDGSP